MQERPPVPAGTRRVVLVAAAGADILDLLGPFQVFTRVTTHWNWCQRLALIEDDHGSRLEETRHSLTRIAEECGLGSVGAMRSVFQRVVGIPPGRYRQHFRGVRPT